MWLGVFGEAIPGSGSGERIHGKLVASGLLGSRLKPRRAIGRGAPRNKLRPIRVIATAGPTPNTAGGFNRGGLDARCTVAYWGAPFNHHFVDVVRSLALLTARNAVIRRCQLRLLQDAIVGTPANAARSRNGWRPRFAARQIRR